MNLFYLLLLSINNNINIIKFYSLKTIKKIYYSNNLYYDFYKDSTILNNTLLTAEHVFPKCYLKKFKNAKRDMHNIYLTNAHTNLFRSNYPFSDSNNKLMYTKYYIPNEFSRGSIVRSILYMIYMYNYLDTNLVIEKELLFDWNKQYPPNSLEVKKNNIVKLYQGNTNPYIEFYDNIIL